MSDTICGHERKALTWVLQREVTGAARFGVHLPTADLISAELAISDPAKLAEMMASEGQRLGIHVYEDDPGDDLRTPCANIFDHCGEICIAYAATWPEWRKGGTHLTFTMQQARALLFAWLDLPDGDSEGALRVLRNAR